MCHLTTVHQSSAAQVESHYQITARAKNWPSQPRRSKLEQLYCLISPLRSFGYNLLQFAARSRGIHP